MGKKEGSGDVLRMKERAGKELLKSAYLLALNN